MAAMHTRLGAHLLLDMHRRRPRPATMQHQQLTPRQASPNVLRFPFGDIGNATACPPRGRIPTAEPMFTLQGTHATQDTSPTGLRPGCAAHLHELRTVDAAITRRERDEQRRNGGVSSKAIPVHQHRVKSIEPWCILKEIHLDGCRHVACATAVMLTQWQAGPVQCVGGVAHAVLRRPRGPP